MGLVADESAARWRRCARKRASCAATALLRAVSSGAASTPAIHNQTQAPVARPAAPARGAGGATPQAFLGGLFGGGKSSGGGAGGGAAAGYRICIDCGWLVSSEDFPDVKACPVCKSPRSRFKAYKGAVKGRPNNSGGAMKQRFQAREW